MGRISNPLERVTPMSTLSVQAGNPAASPVFSELASNIQRIWVQCMGSKHSYAFITPDEAPRAIITTEGDEYSFSIIDGFWDTTFEVPWWAQKNFDAIDVMTMLAVKAQQPPATPSLAYSVWGVTLTDSITTREAPSNQPGPYPYNPRGPWSNANDPWQLLAVSSRIYSPNLASDRSLALRPMISYAPIQSSTTTGINIEVRIHSMFVRDFVSNISAAST